MDQQTVTHDGRATRYQTYDGSGDGPVVLFVHGSGLRHDCWREQAGGDQPWTAVTMDLSGHGESEDVDTDPGPETMAAYVADVEAVASEVEPDVIVGHSLGGAVLQTLLLDGDYVPERAVIADSGPKLGRGEDITAIVDGDFDAVENLMRTANILFADGDHPDHDPTIDLMREQGIDLLSRDLSTCTDFDVMDRLGEIDTHCLCLVGDEDKLTPTDMSSYLAHNIPDAEYVEIPGAAHMSMLEKPETFNDELAAYLDGR